MQNGSKIHPMYSMDNRSQTNLKGQDPYKPSLETSTAQSSLIASEVELALPWIRPKCLRTPLLRTSRPLRVSNTSVVQTWILQIHTFVVTSCIKHIQLLKQKRCSNLHFKNVYAKFSLMDKCITCSSNVQKKKSWQQLQVINTEKKMKVFKRKI